MSEPAEQQAGEQKVERKGSLRRGWDLHKPSNDVAKMSEQPDFTGHWVLTGFDGNVDKQLVEVGVGWLLRTAAQAAGYGVGKNEQKIEHNVDTNQVTVHIINAFK